MNLAGLVVTKRDGNENRMKKMEVSTSTDGATWFPLSATENMPKEWVITAPEGARAKWIKVEAKTHSRNSCICAISSFTKIILH